MGASIHWRVRRTRILIPHSRDYRFLGCFFFLQGTMKPLSKLNSLKPPVVPQVSGEMRRKHCPSTLEKRRRTVTRKSLARKESGRESGAIPRQARGFLFRPNHQRIRLLNALVARSLRLVRRRGSRIRESETHFRSLGSDLRWYG